MIDYLPSDVFQGLTCLKHLFLFDNNIKWLGDGTFRNTIIYKIFLFGNRLSELSNTSFWYNTTEEIHIYNNPMERVAKTALTGISTAAKLFLDCNTIKRIERTPVNIRCISTTYSPAFLFQPQWIDDFHGFSCQFLPNKLKQCSVCKKGTFGNAFETCTSCPPGGFYQDSMGSISTLQGLSCKECPKGTFVKDGNGRSISDCKRCPDGTNTSRHAGFRACYCLDGYARLDRFGPCFACLETGTNCSGQDFLTIIHGYYWNWNVEEANVTEYKKFVYNLKDRSGNYSRFDTRYLLEVPNVFKCPQPQNCKTSVDGIESKCAQGYQGWLCSKCAANYYSIMNKCFHCPSANMLWVEMIFCLLLFVKACHFLLNSDHTKIDGSHEMRSRVDKICSRGKILLGFYQVVGELMTSIYHSTCIENIYLTATVIPYIELNIFRMFIRIQCFHESSVLNFQTKFIIAICFPYGVIIFMFLYYRIKKVYLKIKNNLPTPDYCFISSCAKLKSKLLSVSGIILFITYPSTSNIIFQMYPTACETFCYGTKRIKRLRSDYELPCSDLTAYQSLAFIFTIGYIIAFPAIVLLALLIHMRKIPRDKRNDGLLNRSLVEDELDCQYREEKWVHFLCESYKPQYWYWEVIELSRKVSQTALIPLIGWDNEFTVPLMVLISCFYLNLYLRCMPMKNKFEQNLQIFCLVATVVNVLLSDLEPVEDYDTAMSVVLILLNATPIVILAGEAVLWLFRILRLYVMNE